jgi:type II secretory pathway component PulF
MPVYAYRGKSRAGVEVRGEREADTKQALLAALRREQISLMVKEKGKELSFQSWVGR